MATVEIFYKSFGREIVTDIIDDVTSIKKETDYIGDCEIVTKFIYAKKDNFVGYIKKESCSEFYMRTVPCGE